MLSGLTPLEDGAPVLVGRGRTVSSMPSYALRITTPSDRPIRPQALDYRKSTVQLNRLRLTTFRTPGPLQPDQLPDR